MKLMYALVLWTMILNSTQVWSQRKKHTDSVDVIINLSRHFAKNAPVDSVFIFFDRYNHTGAGIIKQVYYPKDNKVVVPDVPPGKYYIGMMCLGAHWEYFSEVTFVNRRNKNKIRFRLKRSELFIPGNYIAQVSSDLHRLSITSPKSFR